MFFSNKFMFALATSHMEGIMDYTDETGPD